MFCAGLLLSIADLLGRELRSFQPASPQALLGPAQIHSMFLEPFRSYRNKGGNLAACAGTPYCAAAGQMYVPYGDPRRFSTGKLPHDRYVLTARAGKAQTFLDSRSPG